MSGVETAPRVERLWVRPVAHGPVEPRSALELEVGRGAVGDHAHQRRAKRHVTLVFRDGWDAAARDAGAKVGPAGRRANVLLSGPPRLDLVGRSLRLGSAVLAVRGELKPCEVMDRAAEGLCAALGPEGRGGLWATVEDGGVVHPGDALIVLGD